MPPAFEARQCQMSSRNDMGDRDQDVSFCSGILYPGLELYAGPCCSRLAGHQPVQIFTIIESLVAMCHATGGRR